MPRMDWFSKSISHISLTLRRFPDISPTSQPSCTILGTLGYEALCAASRR